MKITPIKNIALAAAMSVAPVVAKADTNTVVKAATNATQAVATQSASLKAVGGIGIPPYTYGAKIGNLNIKMDTPAKNQITIDYPYMSQKPVDLCLEYTTDLKNWSTLKTDLPWAEDTANLNSLGAVTNYSGSVSFSKPNTTGACFRVVDKGIQ